MVSHFRRELLPAPKAFYERELGRLSRPDRKQWSKANCPFHRSKSRSSFSINVASGSFHCFGCGAHGGDILQFVRLRYGLGFKEAAGRIGAWDRAPTRESIRRRQAEARERQRLREAEELEQRAERERRLRVRDNLHTALRLQREFSDLLDEVHSREGDEEECWQLLSLLEDYVRESDCDYCEAAGLECCE